MLDSLNAFVTPALFRSVWNTEYEAFKGSPAESELPARLQRWAPRTILRETSAEPAFIEEFVHQLGVCAAGTARRRTRYTLHSQYPVPGTGAGKGRPWAARCRSLVRDHERLPETVMGLHLVASACIMLRRAADLAAVRNSVYLRHGSSGRHPGPRWGRAKLAIRMQLGYTDAGYQGPRVTAVSLIRVKIVRKPEGQVGFAVHACRWAEPSKVPRA